MLSKLTLLTLCVTSVLAARVPVTGAEVTNSGTPLRRNVDELSNSGAPWDLFILALNAMNDADVQNDTSFFQIAGIHGWPYKEWNDAGSENSTDSAGYCPHNENIFVAWHRPYMALFEQELVRQARLIADMYPEPNRQEYRAAAENLRLPFWDWGFDSHVPNATVPKTVIVQAPGGKTNVSNPLATYKFPNDDRPPRSGNLSNIQTERCKYGNGYPEEANKLLRQWVNKQNIYDLFSKSKNFGEFASTVTNGGSLEGIHGTIHRHAACYQHFATIRFSAFDPLFLLHHANVDRLWAYWEAIHPESAIFNDTYVTTGSRFSTPRGTKITPDSPLKPFFQKDGTTFHTTKSVASIKTFGYSYEDIDSGEDAVNTLINRLYGQKIGSASHSLRVRGQTPTTRYFVQIQLEKGQVELPCQVNLYLRGMPAGSIVAMEQPRDGILHGGFTIDEAIQAGGFGSLSVDSIVESVQSSIEVDITKGDGSRIAVSSVSSLKIELEDVVVTPPASDKELSKFGTPRLRTVDVKERSEGASIGPL
ncbi:tyrosinase [Pochonia chlamydosporia 170]|uniref:Tyrosinase n=1 Tax=Pochonia chlamydosporia 170 TaxID=1380566 RepID=A0A179EWV4_METCM|nr:tyrosinase [Pochonia chlamydosporia 170]OAQ57685.1 tyrosinase [Pochonia chlamydosporia 170]